MPRLISSAAQALNKVSCYRRPKLFERRRRAESANPRPQAWAVAALGTVLVEIAHLLSKLYTTGKSGGLTDCSVKNDVRVANLRGMQLPCIVVKIPTLQ